MQTPTEPPLANGRYFAGPFVLWMTGTWALVPAVEIVKGVVSDMAPGLDLPPGPAVTGGLVVWAILYLVLARIGYSQRLHQTVFRRRRTWIDRTLIGIALVWAVLVIFMTAAALLRGLDKEAKGPALIVLSLIPIYGMLIYAFFFPGRYAAALADRYEERQRRAAGGL
ncbi:MAG: hypothetical protein AAFV19_04800 [Pseudomonadota bacterium]